MKKVQSEALERFLRKEVAEASSVFVYEAMRAFEKEKKADTLDYFLEEVRECFVMAPGLCFLQIVLVRHRTLAEGPFFRMEAFGPQFYLEEPLYEAELAWDWMYGPYYDFCSRIREDAKRYVLQIRREETDRICQEELENTKKIAKYLFDETLPWIIKTEEFRKVGQKLQFHMSEYRGDYEILFQKDHRTEKMGAWLNGIFQDY